MTYVRVSIAALDNLDLLNLVSVCIKYLCLVDPELRLSIPRRQKTQADRKKEKEFPLIP